MKGCVLGGLDGTPGEGGTGEELLGAAFWGCGARWEERRNSPRTRHHQGGTAPTLAPPLHFPGSAFRSQFPVSPAPLLRVQGPTPSHFPLGPQPSGLLRPGNELAPPPRLIPPPPVTMHTPLAFRASGLTRYGASGPRQHESTPAGHSRLGRSNRTPGNPELGVSPGAGLRTCSPRQLQPGAAWSVRGRATQPLWSSTCLAWKMGTIQIWRLSGQM